MQAIGIDIGTTSICGVVIDTVSGKVLKSVTKNSDTFIKTQNDYEKIQSVDKIVGLALGILDSLITNQTAVIGVTGQMHGIVYTDSSGNAVSPLYTWQDGRGNLLYKDGKTYAKHLKGASGYGNVTDFYNRQNGMVPSNAESYCTIHDYFVMRLCRLNKAVVHTSDAASFGNFDIESNRFDYDCNINVADGYIIAGEYNGIPVSVAIGDNQASVLSTITQDDVLINVGTGSQISVISNKAVKADGIETRPFFEGKYLIVGAALCGGRAYAMLKDFYSEIFSYKMPLNDEEIYAIMGEMVQNAIASLKVDTRFSGTRVDENVKGAIIGITNENFNPEALNVGVLEGIIDELLGMYKLMGVEKKGLVGSGNGIRKNRFLIQTAENKLGKTIRIPVNTEEAAVGAAMYGCIAKGIYKDAKTAADVVIKYQ